MNPQLASPPAWPLMWGAIAVAFTIVATVAVYSLDPRIAGYTVGLLLLTCLGVCGAAFWLDERTTRTTRRLLERLGPPPRR